MDRDNWIIKKETIIILLIIIASIVLRLNTNTDYFSASDTNMNLNLISTISHSHYITWNKDELSIIGFSEFSYPLGFSVYANTVSQISGIHIKNMPTIMSIIFAIISILGFYILINRIGNNKRLAIISTIIFSLTPFFLFNTYKILSARQIFILLSVYSLFSIILLFKYRYNKKYIFLAILLLILISICHRMGILFSMITILGYSASRIFDNIKYKNIILITLLFLSIISGFIFFQFDTNRGYDLAITSQISVVQDFVDICYKIGNQFGVIAIISIIGTAYLFLKKEIKDEEMFIAIVLISTLFFVRWLYFIYISLIIIAILTYYALHYITYKIKERKFFYWIIIGMLILSMSFVTWKKIMVYNTSEEWDTKTESLMKYYNYNRIKIFTSNNAELILFIQTHTDSYALGTWQTMIVTPFVNKYEYDYYFNPKYIFKNHKITISKRTGINYYYLYYLINNGYFKTVQRQLDIDYYIYDQENPSYEYYSRYYKIDENILSKNILIKIYDNSQYQVYQIR